MLDLTSQGVTSFSRNRSNELAKGYYPTSPKDIKTVLSALKFDFGSGGKNANERHLMVFDPCAGEGDFLNTALRYTRAEYQKVAVKDPTTIEGYAVELDEERFRKIKTTHKLQGSFFDTEIAGKFSIVLLNPPYHKKDGEILSWIKKAAASLEKYGLMVLIIPDYELHRQEIQDYIKGEFNFFYAFRSEEYNSFKQLVVFLSKNQNNQYSYRYGHFPETNFSSREYPIFSEFIASNGKFSFHIHCNGNESKPLISIKDLEPFYDECENKLNDLAKGVLERDYPKAFDTSIRPLSSLRTAHAVQLAAMNSQIESVSINGTHYLAKYMVTKKAETYKDPEEKTETVLYKPTVEVFLMDGKGNIQNPKNMGIDYYELNSWLSGILLQRLTKTYHPIHCIGDDKGPLEKELKDLGLMPPQREAVKAVMKGFDSGMKGVGIRANTGTGKTWMAKAVKYLSKARRTIMVTKPELVPQMVTEYSDEGFEVHVIDSWESLMTLYRERPKGLYLIPYTRLRMHPDYELVISTRKTVIKDPTKGTDVKYETYCPACRMPVVEKIRKGDKPKCTFCGNPFFTYVAENKKPATSYRTWIRQIETNGEAKKVLTHNKQLPYIKYLKKIPFDFAILDEAHEAANLMSNQGTSMLRLSSTAKKVLVMTATVSNGMAKSLYNILWALSPQVMRENGWELKSAIEFQAKFGAFKEVRKTDERNRHRDSERITTHDIAGISPAILSYTLPLFVNVDSDDFDDLPPVEREVIKCTPHEMVEECVRSIDNILQDACEDQSDRIAIGGVRNAAVLRISDTFIHANDELTLRGVPLGVIARRTIDEPFLEKEERLIEILKGVLARNERALVYTGNTQKIDMRLPLLRIVQENVTDSVTVLKDTVRPDQIVAWFAAVKEQVVIVSYHRVAAGLNLSQFNNEIWYDYTSNPRLAEQGEGRIRRVNTADIHRAMFGEVRPCRYYYLTSSKFQEMQLAYTLEKRMVAKLAEGEVPDIDPADCSSEGQSFSALITSALHKGNFDFKDPSDLLKKMSKRENSHVRAENLIPPLSSPAPAKILPFQRPRSEPEVTYPLIFVISGREETRHVARDEYSDLLHAGRLDVTLFGTYVKDVPRRKAV